MQTPHDIPPPVVSVVPAMPAVSIPLPKVLPIEFVSQASAPLRLVPVRYDSFVKGSMSWMTEITDGGATGFFTDRNKVATVTAHGFTLLALRKTRDMTIASFRGIVGLPELSHFQCLVKLRLTDLNFAGLPSLSSLKTLHTLVIQSVALTVLPLGICDAPRLCMLMVNNCKRLRIIPTDFFSRFPQDNVSGGLKMLIMLNVPCEIPVEICELKTLKVLQADNFSARLLTQGVPFHGVAELALMGHLHARSMFTINVLSLRNVVHLSLDSVKKLQIPSLLECRNLKHITLRKIPFLRLPIGVAEAPKLDTLELEDCFQLEVIDVAFIRRLTQVTPDSPDPLRLKTLRMESLPCVIPQEINELYGLEHLYMKHSRFEGGSADFPDIGHTLTALKTLVVCGYPEYDSLPDNFASLSSLITLKLKMLTIEHLPPSIAEIHSLKRLVMNRLHILDMPHDLSTLSNLESLKITQCLYLYKINMGFIKCPKLSNFCFRDLLVEHHSRQPGTHIFWKLAQLVPAMRDLPMLSIQGSSPKEFEAIGDALQTWPLSRATEVVFDQLLRPSIPGDHMGYNYKYNEDERMAKINKENLKIVHEWHNTQEKVMAFCMGMHSRVGGASIVHGLEELTMSTVVDMVLGRTAYAAKWAAPFATIDSAKALEDFKIYIESYEVESLDEDGEDEEGEHEEGVHEGMKRVCMKRVRMKRVRMRRERMKRVRM